MFPCGVGMARLGDGVRRLPPRQVRYLTQSCLHTRKKVRMAVLTFGIGLTTLVLSTLAWRRWRPQGARPRVHVLAGTWRQRWLLHIHLRSALRRLRHVLGDDGQRLVVLVVACTPNNQDALAYKLRHAQTKPTHLICLALHSDEHVLTTDELLAALIGACLTSVLALPPTLGKARVAMPPISERDRIGSLFDDLSTHSDRAPSRDEVA